MTDIVERLRAGQPCSERADRICRVMTAESGCICAEAADTIERLQAEIERLKDRIDQHHRMFEPLRAELARLKAPDASR